MSLKSFNSPAYIGPGWWSLMHTAAADATTSEKKKVALGIIQLTRERFGCEACRKHFDDFAKSDPPEQYIDEKEGLFAWTYRAHNNANQITNKPILSYEDAHSLYYGSGAVCTKGCGENHSEIKDQIKSRVTPVIQKALPNRTIVIQDAAPQIWRPKSNPLEYIIRPGM